MLRVTNISITKRAASVLSREWARFKADPGEAFALIYVSSFTNADGTTVDGFRPGYMAGPLYVKGLGSNWALARLPDGLEFYFNPRFKWSASDRYVVDHNGTLFSLELAANGVS